MQYAANQQVNQAAAPVAQLAKKRASKAAAIGKGVSAVARNLYHWQWTKALVYWLILSAGTASDLIFLMASFWMSINANVHGLVLSYMSEKQAAYITYLATMAYVGLPIFVVFLAVVQTVNHVKMWKAGGHWAKVWAIVFGIPALTFAVMDFVTLSCSVANVQFTMPTFFVILRADSAFIFAFGSLIYFFLGKPQERERLAKKDDEIASLCAEKDSIIAVLHAEKASILSKATQEKESLVSTIDAKNDEIESLKSLLTQTQKGFSELHTAMNKSSDAALEAYGEECINWLKGGIKSADVPTITHYTRLSTAKINNALKRGELRKAPNSKEDNPLILISTLVPWLRNLAVSERKTDPSMPALHLVNS